MEDRLAPLDSFGGDTIGSHAWSLGFREWTRVPSRSEREERSRERSGAEAEAEQTSRWTVLETWFSVV